MHRPYTQPRSATVREDLPEHNIKKDLRILFLWNEKTENSFCQYYLCLSLSAAAVLSARSGA